MLSPSLHRSPPRAGQVLDSRFRLLQVVQRDRAGVLFDALDERTGDVVRLRSTVGPVDRERLGIQHPGLARALAVAADGSYVVFQDLDDEPLRPALFPSVDRLLQLADAVLPTVAELHRHGIVHGDLQPRSFWRDRQGEVRLIDLGLAVTHGRTVEEEPYVAPERAFGREADDPRIDVYALAAILFHHATGQQPSPSALESAPLPHAVRQVLALALDPRPVFRPRDAAALHRALQEGMVRADELPEMPADADGTLDGPFEGPTETLPPAKRRAAAPQPQGLVTSALLPWWTALLLVGGLCLLTGTVVFLAAVAVGSATLL